jgi:hypothetical protein
MATASARSVSASLASRLVYGIVGGVAGGIVFGVLMQATEMMGMVAQLIGSESVFVGWLVHLFNSALFGAIFALLFAKWAGGLMPAWLGMSEMVFQFNKTAWQSLAGHLLYGLVLGVAVAVLTRRARND